MFSKEYKRLLKKYPSLKGDLLELACAIRANPLQGVDLGHNIRKIRLAIASKGKGKSGGARVVTFNLLAEIDNQRVVLVTIFDKGERESMSVESLRTIINNSGF